MDTLCIAGGKVLRPDMTVEMGDVLVDRDTGEILAVGDVEAGETTLDATGGVVIPGLVNAHTHAAMTLLRGYADDKPLEAWLREDVWPIEAELTSEDVRVGTELALCEMIRSGTTAFCDMYFHERAVADAVATAGVRALLGRGVITAGTDDDAAIADLDQGLAFAREYDGYAGGRVRTACMPHSLTTVDEPHLTEYIAAAREDALPVHYHANETLGEVEPIVDERGERPLTYADERGMVGPKDFLAHGVHLNDEEIALLAARGTGVVHCPASNAKLASGMAPVRELLEAGVPVGIGTDGAASNNDLDLFDEVRDAAMIGKLAANNASAVDAPTALGMATRGSAELLGFDSGRIEPGANADLAVLDFAASHLTPVHDPVSHLVYAARGSDVRHTVCDGEVLMRDRELLTLAEERVRADAQERATALVERAES